MKNLKVTIEKLDYEGKGITHIEQKIVFVPKVLPQEEVEIHIEKEQKTFSLGKVEKILKKSKLRIPSFCPYSKQCGGCTYDIVKYINSIKLKKESLIPFFFTYL